MDITSLASAVAGEGKGMALKLFTDWLKANPDAAKVVMEKFASILQISHSSEAMLEAMQKALQEASE